MESSVCFVVGARPNFMKVAPVVRALEELDAGLELLLVHTGQHYDETMSDVFFAELELPEPNVDLTIGSGTHAEQTARALTGIERILARTQPDLLVVAGDVNSTLAAALAAVKLDVPVAHVESGLRSFDWTMPEEHNRRLTDHMSSLLLTHSASAGDNLRREGIDDGRIAFVGNTMIDSLLVHLRRARQAEPWTRLGLEPRRYGLVTLHRPSLVDDPDLLHETVGALVDLARDFPLAVPLHPRTRARLISFGLGRTLKRAVLVTPPLSYETFLGLEAEARFVVTDSGGVQEETSALGVPCFTLRDSTERPITVELGTNTLLGATPGALRTVGDLLPRAERRDAAIPLWDGGAGKRAAGCLARFLGAATPDVVEVAG